MPTCMDVWCGLSPSEEPAKCQALTQVPLPHICAFSKAPSYFVLSGKLLPGGRHLQQDRRHPGEEQGEYWSWGWREQAPVGHVMCLMQPPRALSRAPSIQLRKTTRPQSLQPPSTPSSKPPKGLSCPPDVGSSRRLMSARVHNLSGTRSHSSGKASWSRNSGNFSWTAAKRTNRNTGVRVFHR